MGGDVDVYDAEAGGDEAVNIGGYSICLLIWCQPREAGKRKGEGVKP